MAATSADLSYGHYLTNQATMYIYAPKSLIWRASYYYQQISIPKNVKVTG
jgi:hypothetical protein